MNRRDFTVDVDEKTRLDKYLADYVDLMTRSRLKELLSSLKVNGKPAKLSTQVSSGDRIVVEYDEPPVPTYSPEFIPLDILYEDNDVIIVNKPRDMVVHPAAGNHQGTLVQGLMYHIRELSENFDGERVRPGIVHRLDKDTSGILIAAKNPEALEFLAVQFRKKQVQKIYLAIVKGTVRPPEGIIEKGIIRNPTNRKKFTWSETEGKTARTIYRVLRQYDGAAFVLLQPETGRTHQLRVHMLSQGNPILGDPLYSRKSHSAAQNLMLHAYILEIRLPGTPRKAVFRAPVPDDFKRALLSVAKKQ